MKRVECYDDLPEWIKARYGTIVPELQHAVWAQFSIGAYAYLFTDEEKERIAEILNSGRLTIPADNIDLFIVELEGIASQKKYEILDTPTKADTRAARQEIIDDGKTLLKHLEGIVTCRRQWVVYEDLEPGDDPIEDDDEFIDGRFTSPVTHTKFKVWGLADTIREPLKEMIETLENFQSNESKKRGREKADADNFTKLVAKAYSRHIGKPSTYDKGCFFEIVERVLDILNISQDPTRAIRQALKK